MQDLSASRDCAFSAFITNLGKYNEGYLIGEWVKFPVTNEELQAVFQREEQEHGKKIYDYMSANNMYS